jgi:hypothetical protein
MEQHDRFRRVAEVLQIAKDFLIGDAGSFTKATSLLLGGGAHAHFVDQFLFFSSEVVFLEQPFPFREGVFISHS